jgi:hypothetical protein
MEPPLKKVCVPSAYSTVTVRQCTGLLRALHKMESARPFLNPVDPMTLNLPDYPHIVKNPMDLGTIEKRIDECARCPTRRVREPAGTPAPRAGMPTAWTFSCPTCG